MLCPCLMVWCLVSFLVYFSKNDILLVALLCVVAVSTVPWVGLKSVAFSGL